MRARRARRGPPAQRRVQLAPRVVAEAAPGAGPRGPRPQRPGRKAKRDDKDTRIAELEKKLARAEKKLSVAKSVIEFQKNTLRARSRLLDQKLPTRYGRRGPGGAAGCFLATTAIP